MTTTGTKTESQVLQDFRILEASVQSLPLPEIERLRREGASPLRILIGCILSSRTRDSAVRVALGNLMSSGQTLSDLLLLNTAEIDTRIKPVGFHTEKASRLHALFRMIKFDMGGEIPASRDKILSLPGVGPKTAALFLSASTGATEICVDVHVLRIANRLGWVLIPGPWSSKNMEECVGQLSRILPRSVHGRINAVLVSWGQHVCLPVRPRCDQCPIDWCPAGKKRKGGPLPPS